MARQTINGSPGLYTAANAEILPPGSLAVAKGVVIRRPGLIQKARPFRQYSYGGDSIFTGISYGIGFGLSRMLLTNTDGNLWYETATPGVFTDSGHIVDKRLRTAESNSNLYLLGGLFPAVGTLGSVAKITASGSAPFVAGCPRSLDPILSSLASGSLLTAGQSRAYRAVYTFTDANGNYVFGAPSGPVTFTATGAQDVSAKVLLHADIYSAANATSYRVQLYASNIVASGSNPDDEMQLVADYGITAADVANKYVTIYDNTPDNLKGILGGAYLYTNPGQQTIAAANYQPPIANDIALFKGSMFYANTKQKHRASLAMIGPPEVWAIQSIAANSPIAGQSTYTFSASVDLTGIDNTMKLAVVNSTGASNDGTWAVVSINNAAHTVVVTNAGVAQVGAAGSAMSGRLVVGNTTYYPIFAAESVASHYYTVPSTGTSQGKVSAATQSLVRIINQQTASNVVAYNTTNPLSPAGEMAFEEKSIGGTAFTVTAFGTTTAGYRGAYSITFSPAIPSATPLTSLNDAKKNRLHISKSGQPEHCPLSDSYYFDIGAASKAILRILALRNALLVFKEDGLFRVTGDSGVFSWAPFDPTQILVHANTVNTIQNTAVALTERGVWQFTETSSRYLSGPIEDRVSVVTSLYSSTAYNISPPGTVADPAMSVSAKDGMVYLNVATQSAEGAYAGISVAYCLQTGAWTEQYAGFKQGNPPADGVTGQVEFASLAFVSVNGSRFGVANDGVTNTFDVYAEDQFVDTLVSTVDSIFSDLSAGGEPTTGHKYLINVLNVNAGANQITAVSQGGPPIDVGTLISDAQAGHSVWRVTNVNGAVLTLEFYSGAGNFGFTLAVRHYKYAPQPIQVDYNPYSAGDDGGLNEFTEVVAILDPLSTTTSSSVSIGCYTENWPATSMGMMPVPSATTFNRIGVEGSAQVARHLSVRITHSNPLEYFYLRSVSYLFEPVEGSVATN